MANEKRLIDALELSDRLGKLDAQNRNDGLLMADNELWKMPVVDAVEVVRCKDCVKRETVLCPMETYDDFPWRASREDDFCSYGKRST